MKLYTKICTKIWVVIHMGMDSNTLDKSYQLKLNEINC